jgi:hypothetical protein
VITGDTALLMLDSRGLARALHPGMPTRHESRQKLVRMVEHRPFPRAHAGEGRAVGFTRDLSRSGMCISVERPEALGSLLHLILYGLDGRPTLDSIARVARCERDARGRLWLGLALVDPARAETALPRRRLLAVLPAHAGSRLAVA